MPSRPCYTHRSRHAHPGPLYRPRGFPPRIPRTRRLHLCIFVPQLIRLMELFVRHSGSGAQILTLFFCIFPSVFVFTVPMATLIGVLLGLGRMSADSEIIALTALGIGRPPGFCFRWSAGAHRRGGDAGDDGLARSARAAHLSYAASRLDHLAGFLCLTAAGIRRALSEAGSLRQRRGGGRHAMARRVSGRDRRRRAVHD